MSSKRKIILISIIFGVINIFVLIFLLLPCLKDIGNTFNELAIIRKRLVSSQELLESVGEIRNTYKGIEADSNKIDSLFVDRAVPIGVIEFWENTASNSKIDLNPSSIILKSVDEKEKKSSPWNFLLFQISLKGNFSNFLKFLEKNESGPYLMEIQTIAIREADAASGNVNVNLGGKVFTK